MATHSPSGVNISALLSRLVITWCSQRGSARTGAAASCRSTAMPGASNRRAKLSAAAAARSARPHGCRGRCKAAASRQVLQVANHPRQPQHLITQRAEFGGGGFGDAVQQRLMPGLQHRDRGRAARGRQRRRGCGGSVPAGPACGHLVERGRQLAQLGRARTGPAQAERSSAVMAWVTAISLATGRVIRRAATRSGRAAEPPARPPRRWRAAAWLAACGQWRSGPPR